jgi:hypothetical protein
MPKRVKEAVNESILEHIIEEQMQEITNLVVYDEVPQIAT